MSNQSIKDGRNRQRSESSSDDNSDVQSQASFSKDKTMKFSLSLNKTEEISYLELNKRKAMLKEWKTIMSDILVFQRGKIPLLLAVEAGNQSMCRELLSSQTSEQLKVCTIILSLIKMFIYSIFL